MDKLAKMRAFVAIVERGSLTAAAKVIRTSLPTVVRSLAALEAELGVRLVNRTTRRVSITPEGQVYYEHSRHLLEEIGRVERTLGERGTAPKGRVLITAPVTFGRRHVVPLLTEFLAEHGEIAVELRLLDRIVNLADEGMDLAVRLAKLADSSSIAVNVGHTRQMICASGEYLSRRGTPKRPLDLAEHACIRLIDSSTWKEWPLRVGKKILRVPVVGPFDTNVVDAALEACQRGIGCARFLGYQVVDAIRTEELRAVLVRHEPPPIPIHVVYPHARLLSARVRAVIDWLVPRLRERTKAL